MEKCAVLIYHQQVDITIGLIPWGHSLAAQLGGTLGVLVTDESEAEKLKKVGSDIVYTLIGGPWKLFPEEISEIVVKVVERTNPQVILCAATKAGNEIAARVAETLLAGCISECQHVEIGPQNKLLAKRSLYAGVAIGLFEAQTNPCVCTLSLGSLNKENNTSDNSACQLLPLDIPFERVPKEIADVKNIEKTIDLTKAKRIVSMGRGVAKQIDISMVEDLAQILNAEVGCSRPIAEELKWLPDERKVGITGVTVKPELYMALGISGQVQHFVGMKDSKIIVAINNNKSAPIFKFADYGIVGDIYKVIPELIKAVNS